MPRGGRRGPGVSHTHYAARFTDDWEAKCECYSCHGERPAIQLMVPMDRSDLAEFGMCGRCYSRIMRLWSLQGARPETLDRYYKKLYRITLEEYGRMFFMQCGCCAICATPAETKPLVVDHDHDTNKVRGLLCGTCNSAIGLLKDDPEVIVKAALYLAKRKP